MTRFSPQLALLLLAATTALTADPAQAGEMVVSGEFNYGINSITGKTLTLAPDAPSLAKHPELKALTFPLLTVRDPQGVAMRLGLPDLVDEVANDTSTCSSYRGPITATISSVETTSPQDHYTSIVSIARSQVAEGACGMLGLVVPGAPSDKRVPEELPPAAPFQPMTKPVLVSGRYTYSPDQDVFGDVVCFTPDKAGRTFGEWFCFEDTDKARLGLAIPAGATTDCGWQGRATVQLTAYVANHESEGEMPDFAELGKVISKDAPAVLPCEG